MKIAIRIKDGKVLRVFAKGAPADLEVVAFENYKNQPLDGSSHEQDNINSYRVEVQDFAETGVNLFHLFT